MSLSICQQELLTFEISPLISCTINSLPCVRYAMFYVKLLCFKTFFLDALIINATLIFIHENPFNVFSPKFATLKDVKNSRLASFQENKLFIFFYSSKLIY